MPIDQLDRFRICNGDKVWLNADYKAKAFVCFVNGPVATSSSTLIHQPQVGESGWKGSRDIPETPSLKVWKKIIEQGKGNQDVRVDQKGKKHRCNRI